MADVTFDDPRTLVLLGHLPRPELASSARVFAASRGWPVVAEPFGELGTNPALPGGLLLLDDDAWLDDHQPARVVIVGRLTLTRSVGRLLRRPGVVVEKVEAGRFRLAGADSTDGGSLTGTRPTAVENLTSSWLTAWQDAASLAAQATSDLDLPWHAGPRVAQAVWATGHDVVLGSSALVRDAAMVLPAAPLQGQTAYANRGVAGIDGTVSTAIGVALGTGRPTLALMGDLTFLHDTNGLLIGPGELRPDLTIVVVNDDGGGIFHTLEFGEPGRVPGFERVFGTPTGTDLAALCSAHGVPFTRVDSAATLDAAFTLTPRALRVVEVPSQRDQRRQWGHQLRVATRAALA